GAWRVDAQLEPLFAAPRRAHMAAQKVRERLERREWAAAKALLPDVCGHSSQQQACAAATEQIEHSLAHAADTQDVRAAMTIESHSLKGLVSGSMVIPALAVTLHNGSNEVVDLIWVEVNRGAEETEVCRLMGSPPPDDAQPLTLPPQSSREGWCRLGQHHKGPRS